MLNLSSYIRNIRKIAVILTVSAAAALFTGCGAETDKDIDGPVSKNSESVYYSFVDSAGNDIVLKEMPEKVAVLFSSFADIWKTAGGEIDITVGESVERGFAADDVLLVDSGAGKTINTELLISYSPDFVIVSNDIAGQIECADFLSQTGIPCARMHVESFEDYLSALEIFTDITGCSDRYETYGTDVKAEIDGLVESVKSNNNSGEKADGGIHDILFIRAASSHSATKAKTAEDNFVCVMLNELGTHNIAEDAPVLLDGLSTEEILRADPDYIFFTVMGSEASAKAYVEELFAEPAWKSLSAVSEGNYCFLPKELFHYKPNSRWAEAYKYLYDILYGDDININPEQ